MQLFAALVGAVFVVVGVAGFIPGIVTDYDRMAFAGAGSEAMLFGVFCVSILHNIVHLVFGALGLAAWRNASAARGYLVFGGGLYLLLAVYGAAIDPDSWANFLPLNRADNWLHFGLGIGMIGLGVLGTAIERARSPASRPQTGA